MSFSRIGYPGNGDSPIGFQQTALGERYKVINKATLRVLGLVERVYLQGKKTPRWAIVRPDGRTGSPDFPTRTTAAVTLYRNVTGKSLSWRGA